MTDEALLVVFHSLDTVAPMVAPKPTNPANNAIICLPDIVLKKCLGKVSEVFRNHRFKNVNEAKELQ